MSTQKIEKNNIICDKKFTCEEKNPCQETAMISFPRFQYVSDLHLDLQPSVIDMTNFLEHAIPVSGRNLILAGDVAQLNWSGWPILLNYCTKKWKNIFYVPGNHEYYESSLYTGHMILKRFEQQYPNFLVLQNRCIHMDEKDNIVVNNESGSTEAKQIFKIVGCTLWSDIPPEAEDQCFKSLNDFASIKNFSLRMYQTLHKQDKAWLEQQISGFQSNSDQKTSGPDPQHDASHELSRLIVITHHAPLMNQVSHPKYEKVNRTVNHAFCSDLSSLVEMMPENSYWVFGHTHHRNRFKHKHVNIVTNALGYRGERFTSSFEPQVFD
jgi:hypothetical protein